MRRSEKEIAVALERAAPGAFVDALQDERILVVPGRGFGMAGHVRLSCSVDEAIIARSAEGFVRAVARCR